jgi:hypothetical protein
MGRILRVLIGFAAACLAAGLSLVLFVYTPVELASLPPGMATDRTAEAGLLSLAVATHAAKFAAPLAALAAIVGEGRRIRSWTYYVLVGIVIAVLGFLMQHFSETTGQPTILNNYALTAFIATGFIAGLVYWLFSGRYVKRGDRPAVKQPPAATPPTTTATVTPASTTTS